MSVRHPLPMELFDLLTVVALTGVTLAGAVRIIARYTLPFLLIAIGLYILTDSGTDVLVQ